MFPHQATGRRTLLPHRSKLCKSHWSNQWLTLDSELGVIGTTVVLVAGVACGTDDSGQAPAAGPSDPVVEVTGMVWLAAAETDKRFVIRYPSDGVAWNGRLVVAAHGGTGGLALAADGTQVGTSETSLDDLVGDYAIAQGFAYACVDRDGIGGTPQGLAVVTEFAGIARARVAEALGRDAEQMYLVGLSMGGGIARLAAEAAAAPFDGVVIIAGALGDAERSLDRLARRAALWQPVENAHLRSTSEASRHGRRWALSTMSQILPVASLLAPCRATAALLQRGLGATRGFHHGLLGELPSLS